MERPRTDVDRCRYEDEALVEAARRDPDAFGVLYQRYLPQVYRYLRARTGSPEDAADLAQHVFLKAWVAMPQYRPTGSRFAPWLFRIARNVVADFHRRRRPVTDVTLVPGPVWGNEESSPESVVLRREELARLDALYRALDPAKQELSHYASPPA